MESDNVLSQMARYDFNRPVIFTVIMEESEEEYLPNNELEDLNKENNNNIRLIHQEKTDTTNNIQQLQHFINKTLPLQSEYGNNILEETETSFNINKDCPTADENIRIIDSSKDEEMVENQNPLMLNNKDQAPTHKSNNDVTKQSNNNTNNKEVIAYIKDLLNILSKHLLLITEAYYNHYNKNPGIPMSNGLIKQLNNEKLHFFELSYNIVASLILPQENDETLVNKFIDNTVQCANKVFNWKCGRHHIEPFFYEMVDWARRKREQNPPITPQLSITNSAYIGYKNRLLKNRLAKPLQPLNISSTIEALFDAHNQNNVQILGSKKSKNIVPKPRCDDNFVPNLQPNTEDNAIPRESLPPRAPLPLSSPYSAPSSNNTSATPPQQGRIHQIKQDLQKTRNYLSITNSYIEETAYNKLGVLHNTQNVEETTSCTIKTNVASLNPPSTQYGKCCMCGKSTRIRCSKCKHISYCSIACKILDPRNYRNASDKAG